ncbi:MAG: hypothetical protein ACE5HI_18380, partial [bacterium]
MLIILICLGIAILIKRKAKLLHILKGNKWILALFVYMALSIAWSNFPEISFKRWVRSTGTLIMVLVVLTEANPMESITALLRRCYYAHLPLSIISIKYFRKIGVDWSKDGVIEMWRGLAMHKNNLGQVVMSSGLFFTWHMMKNWGRNIMLVDFLFVIMSVSLLRGSSTSNSNTAVLCFWIGIFVLLSLQYIKQNIEYARRSAFNLVLVLSFLFSFMYLGLGAYNEKPFAVAVGAVGRDETLTGRTGLWSD